MGKHLQDKRNTCIPMGPTENEELNQQNRI
jgi:hypothetical protein